MNVYSVPVKINNTDVKNAFIFLDSDITGGNFPGYQDTGYNYGNADEILQWFDSTIDTALWRKAPQACYNRGATTTALSVLVPLITEYWGTMTNFKPLPTWYSDSATISSTATIEDVPVSISSTFTKISTAEERTDILVNSPFNFAIGSGYPIFTFAVLPDNAIQDGKLALSTEMYYALMNFRILRASENDWQLNAYVGAITTIPQSWVDDLNGLDVYEPDTDPYSDDDESETGGGSDSGDQDAWDDGDTTPVPGLPELSATDTGFITLYNPNLLELQNLASYMWTGLFDVNNFRKIVANPMDTILGLSIVPVNVPAGTSQAVMVGNISTGVSMTKAASQYVEVDCGKIKIKELRHSYLDYSPYTKISIMLPYIGSHDLTIDQLYASDDGALGCIYHIDILSGACVAFITFNDDVIAQYSGQCAVSIPINGNDFTNTIRALTGLVSAGVGMVASGGLSAPVSAASIAGGITAAANTAVNVASSKPTYSRSGNIGGANGIMAVQKPYVILERPRLCAPANQNKYAGYPGYITYSLSNLSGFTQIEHIRLNGIPMTDSERTELLSMLREGVIL